MLEIGEKSVTWRVITWLVTLDRHEKLGERSFQKMRKII